MAKSSFFSGTGVSTTNTNAIENSVESAAASATAASTSATSAAASATSASANIVANQASAAASEASKVTAVAAKVTAVAAQAAALTSANNASTSATASEASKVTAVAAQTSATASSTSAATSASTATTKASAASISQAAAATSAANAQSHASSALPLSGGNLTGNLGLPVNGKLILGSSTSNSLQVYNDGSNSIITESSAGSLLLRGNNLSLQDVSNNNYVQALSGGAVTLYDNTGGSPSPKIATSSSGASISGNIAVTGTVDGRDVATDGTKLDGIATSANNYVLPSGYATETYVGTQITALVDSSPAALNTLNELAAALGDDANFSTTVTNSIATKLPLSGGNLAGNINFGASNKAIFNTNFEIYRDASNAIISETGAGSLILRGTNLSLQSDDNDQYIQCVENGAVTLYHQSGGNSSPKAATSATGIDITGNVVVSGTVDGRDVATDGTKLDGVEASADVTDTANVTAAGALMDSELTSIASVKALNQGVATGDSPTFAGLNASGNLTLDVAGDITLDADGGDILFADGGTLIADFENSNSDFKISSLVPNKDFILGGNDNGTFISALTLDMSAAGAATFNSDVTTGGKLTVSDGGNTTVAAIRFNAGLGISAPSTDQMNFITADNTRMVIDSSGNVGIGVSPSNKLDIKGTVGFEATNSTNKWLAYTYTDNTFRLNYNGAGADELTIDSSGKLTSTVAGGVFETRSDGGGFHYKQLLDVATAGCLITGQSNRGDMAAIALYQTATGADGGYIKFNTSNSGSTTPTEKMRIDSSGNVLVGKTASGINTAGHEFLNYGRALHTVTASTVQILNRKTNDGDIALFQKDGATVGSIGVVGGDEMFIASAGTTAGSGLRFQNEGHLIYPTDGNGDVSDGDLDLGDPNFRFKDLHLSGNANIGANINNYVATNSGNPEFSIGSSATNKLLIQSVYNGGTQLLNYVNFMTYTTAGHADAGKIIFGVDEVDILTLGDSVATFQSGAVFNESGSGQNFRIESTGNDHMLCVDGGTNKVGIGRSAPASIFEVHMATNKNIGFSGGQGELSSIPALVAYTDAGSTTDIGLRGTTVRFASTSQERMRIDETGVVVNEGGHDADFRVASDANTHMLFVDGGNNNLMIGNTVVNPASGFSAQAGFGYSASGQVQIAATSNLATLVLGQNQGTNGSILDFRKQGTQVGSISVTGSATAYNTSSDQRLKENIADADDSGSKVDAIQVRKFDWKADGSHQDYGMVAQELQTVAPEAVSAPENPDEMMGVDYSKLVPMLIKEIQSLRQRVAQLEE